MSTYRGGYIYQGDRRLAEVNAAIMADRQGREPDQNELTGNLRSISQAARQRRAARAREAQRRAS